MGAKKSMVMDPNVQLKDILIKICRERGTSMHFFDNSLFTISDSYGRVLPTRQEWKSCCNVHPPWTDSRWRNYFHEERCVFDVSNFTCLFLDEKTDMSLIPPLIEALERELAARNEQDGQFGSNSRKSKKYIIDGSKSEKPSKDSPSPSHSRQSISPSLSTKDVLQSKEVEKEPPKEEYASIHGLKFSVSHVRKILEVYSLDEELGNGAFSVVYSSRVCIDWLLL